ncbi:MAG: M18 family aminopeptidase [Lachnospiraceae bacterium]|nr:M18 family aminopeptidase [Lachnospiraceae bacterium]
MEYISELMEFLDGSLTSYHAIQNVRRLLLREGYAELSEREIWKLEAGGKYFVVRNDSSMMAFCLPTDSVDKIKGYHVYAAHSDSPAFKIKESPEMEKEGVYVSMNTEKYGGMILSTWFDRPLVIAGRVCVENEGALETYPVQLKENTCMIPSLAIHMNREANSGMAFSAQNDMAPLLGMTGNSDMSSKGMIKAMLAETLNDMTGGDYRAEDILSYDLFVENCEKAVLAGMENEFIMTPRYDDLACVFAGCKGIMHARPERYIDVLAIFDNEEVGSLTRQGADSTFLRDTLQNIADGLGISANACRTWIADSFLLSADNAHACHPNQGGKADLTNRPYLNKGVVLKYHGGQKYATDAYSAAYVKRLCRQNDIPLQTYANHSDIPGGSTLGNLAMAQVSMAAADIGLPQLSMHSACETAGARDIEHLIRLAKAFYKD